MATEVTLKRIGFKPGRTEQPGVVAEIVLICDKPEQVLDLVPHISQVILVKVQGIQQALPLDEPHENGVAMPAAGRRRGTRSSEQA